jgi:hypothetical protein
MSDRDIGSEEWRVDCLFVCAGSDEGVPVRIMLWGNACVLRHALVRDVQVAF